MIAILAQLFAKTWNHCSNRTTHSICVEYSIFQFLLTMERRVGALNFHRNKCHRFVLEIAPPSHQNSKQQAQKVLSRDTTQSNPWECVWHFHTQKKQDGVNCCSNGVKRRNISLQKLPSWHWNLGDYCDCCHTTPLYAEWFIKKQLETLLHHDHVKNMEK